jgi:hypothetical protein
MASEGSAISRRATPKDVKAETTTKVVVGGGLHCFLQTFRKFAHHIWNTFSR